MKRADENSFFPRARKIEGRLLDLVGQLRMDVERVLEPKAQALLETSAEVLSGLAKSFDDYRAKREKAWQTQGAAKTRRPRRRSPRTAR